MRKYAKGIVATVGAGATAALALVAPHTTLWSVLTVVAAICTAAGVYLVSNEPTPPEGVAVGKYVG